jgi:hypothetical protein
MTNIEKSVENSFRVHEVVVFGRLRFDPLWRLGDSRLALSPTSNFPIAAHPET